MASWFLLRPQMASWIYCGLRPQNGIPVIFFEEEEKEEEEEEDGEEEDTKKNPLKRVRPSRRPAVRPSVRPSGPRVR